MPRVLVVDDSPTSRALLVSILSDDEDLIVVGEAANGHEAVQMTSRLRPDVITMDINMPGMDGFEATKQIMIDTPTPIVIVSASAMLEEVTTGLRTLRAGALTLVQKPAGPATTDFRKACLELSNTVKLMADVKVVRHFRQSPPDLPLALIEAGHSGDSASKHHSANAGPAAAAGPATTAGVVALAASTGGPPAIQHVLANLPADFPLPILVVQHIAKGFSEGFAKWLDSTVVLPVVTAQPSSPLTAGKVFVAPENGHLGVSHGRLIEISDAPNIGGFRPSASYLFNSVAGVYRDDALAVIMTGMGSDGVEGLRAVKHCGGTVIAQDQATSVVFGMPGAAVRANVVDDLVGLDQVADKIQQFVKRRISR